MAEEAVHHFEVATGIASSSSWYDQLFWIHLSMARLFSKEGRFDGAHTHIGHAKSHTINDAYLLARAMGLQAEFWRAQRRFEEAKSEVLGALDALEKLGATNDAEDARRLLQRVDEQMNELITSDESDDNGELLEAGAT